MRKLILSAVFFLLAAQLFAQTEGISYQAVIIGPDKQELPGADAIGNILPNTSIAVRFSILDGTNAVVYQEVQNTKTDQYGRINLLIGKAEPDKFSLIDWDGTAKDLKVEINFSGSGSSFVDMSREQLTFIPYAYHRNVTARGNLVVDGLSDLNGELKVQGPANLYSTLNVNDSNATNLSGTLVVGGHANLKNGLTVEGVTTLDSLDIAGDLKVAGQAVFDGPAVFNEPTDLKELTVNGPSDLKGQLTVTMNDSTVARQEFFDEYALKVQGSEQGIAIKLNGIDNDNPSILTDVPVSGSNNFISFWDKDEGKMWGRIEGQSIRDLETDPEFEIERGGKVVSIITNTADVAIAVLEWGQGGLDFSAALTSTTACIGLGGCVTLPIPSWIASKAVNLILKIANIVSLGGNLAAAIADEAAFEYFKQSQIGVSYSSGAGDYAEWLPKKNPSEIFINGEVVGVTNGLVTKNILDAQKIMIVSTRPAVLGNMPQQKDESKNVKIAFMGQVPANVIGTVEPGDYILPNDLVDGFGKAVHPKNMKASDYKRVAGVAWEVVGKLSDNVNIVNVAVGINTNDLSDLLAKLEEKILALQADNDQLKLQMEKSNMTLATLVPGYAEAMGYTVKSKLAISGQNKQSEGGIVVNDQLIRHNPDNTIHFRVSDKQIAEAIDMAREEYRRMQENGGLVNQLLSGNSKTSLRAGKNRENVLKDNIVLTPIAEHPFWKRIDTDHAYKQHIIEFIQEGIDKAYQNQLRDASNFRNLQTR